MSPPSANHPMIFPSLCWLVATAACLALCESAPAAILLQDSFGGLNTSNRLDAAGAPVLINSSRPELAGIRAETPNDGTAVWTAPGGSKVKTWYFTFSSIDPFEPPSPLETPPLNGSASFQGLDNTGADALLPFSAPAGAYQVSLDAVSGAAGIALGFSASETVLTNNFASLGEVWLSLAAGFQGDTNIIWTLHTHGTNGPSVSGTTTLQGYNRLAVAYDPVTHLARGSVNGVLTPTLSYTVVGINAVGFEGSGTVDDFVVQTVNGVANQPTLSLAVLPSPANAVRVSGDGATPGVTYGVESTTDLRSGNWLRLGSSLADGAGRFNFTNTPGTSSAQYYRSVFP